MVGLEAGLALVAFADQCIKYGNKLVKRCKNYRKAAVEAKALLITVEYNWLKTEAQIKFLKIIHATLDERYVEMQSLLLSELEGQLKTATLTMDKLIEKTKRPNSHDASTIVTRMLSLATITPGHKVVYAFRKDSIQALIDDLEKWQRRFDPCWMLIMRMEARNIDNELSQESRKPPDQQTPFIMMAKEIRDAVRVALEDAITVDTSIWLPADSIQPSFETIDFSAISVHSSKLTGSGVLMETMHCDVRSDINRSIKDARDLARVLHKINTSDFGLLNCKGVVKGSETLPDQFGEPLSVPTFTFVFETPKGLQNPRTLRSLLLNASRFPLNERLDLARRLTYSVLYLHSASFVHKNIRPETILVFQNQVSSIGAPFLVGFEKFRPAGGHTYLIGDESWEKNLYRHPTRQGMLPENQYNMQHDIYSVGVVLLEIGLWDSLVYYSRASGASKETLVPKVSELVSLSTASDEKDSRFRAFQNKEILEDLAERELPHRLGRKFTDMVLLCLRCLDNREGGCIGGDRDGDGVAIGVSFIESVLELAHQISL